MPSAGHERGGAVGNAWHVYVCGCRLSGVSISLAHLARKLDRDRIVTWYPKTVSESRPTEPWADSLLTLPIRLMAMERDAYYRKSLRQQLACLADAIVFVVPSTDWWLPRQVAYLEDMVACCPEGLGDVPGVIQLTALDMPDSDPERVLAEVNPMGWPVVRTLPPTGEGVLETYETLLQELERASQAGLKPLASARPVPSSDT